MIPPDTRLLGADGVPIDNLSDRPLSDHEVAAYDGPVPVLFGHYWWQRQSPGAISPLAGCLDFSVARSGDLVAYRWDGESTLDEAKLVIS
jgi:hypothetical protein